MEKVLIMGVGNYLMGDEGIGVHAVKELQKENLPGNIEIIDGGTGGFHLLEYLSSFKKVIMIDATIDGLPAGSVKVIRPKFSRDFPRALSAHDIGLRDLIETAELLGELPEIHLITVSIDSISNMEVELSEPAKNSIPTVISRVKEILNGFNN